MCFGGGGRRKKRGGLYRESEVHAKIADCRCSDASMVDMVHVPVVSIFQVYVYYDMLIDKT